MPFTLRNEVFKKLEEIVDIASLSKEDRDKYDESIKIYRDNLVTMEYAVEKGRAEGRAEGIIEGRAEGQIAGEKKKQKEIAKVMKKKGFAANDIAELTGLSIEEVDTL